MYRKVIGLQSPDMFPHEVDWCLDPQDDRPEILTGCQDDHLRFQQHKELFSGAYAAPFSTMESGLLLPKRFLQLQDTVCLFSQGPCPLVDQSPWILLLKSQVLVLKSSNLGIQIPVIPSVFLWWNRKSQRFFIVKSHGYITCFSHVKSHFLSYFIMGKYG